jgi:hypothetical protein
MKLLRRDESYLRMGMLKEVCSRLRDAKNFLLPILAWYF